MLNGPVFKSVHSVGLGVNLLQQKPLASLGSAANAPSTEKPLLDLGADFTIIDSLQNHEKSELAEKLIEKLAEELVDKLVEEVDQRYGKAAQAVLRHLYSIDNAKTHEDIQGSIKKAIEELQASSFASNETITATQNTNNQAFSCRSEFSSQSGPAIGQSTENRKEKIGLDYFFEDTNSRLAALKQRAEKLSKMFEAPYKEKGQKVLNLLQGMDFNKKFYDDIDAQKMIESVERSINILECFTQQAENSEPLRLA